MIVLCAAATASAATYEFAFSCPNVYYPATNPVNVHVDFGQSFTSIQSLTVEWTGTSNPGWYQWKPGEWEPVITEPLRSELVASLDNVAEAAQSLSDPLSSYPKQNQLMLKSGQDWSSLLDGSADLSVVIRVINPPFNIVSYPYARFTSTKLILEATPASVPEPASIIALVCGLGAFAWRRKR